MATDSRKDDMLAVVAVVILVIGAATGNAYVMLGMSVAVLVLLVLLFRRQIWGGALLVSFVAAVTAAVIGVALTAIQ